MKTTHDGVHLYIFDDATMTDRFHNRLEDEDCQVRTFSVFTNYPGRPSHD
jgi:hypothetical protein